MIVPLLLRKPISHGAMRLVPMVHLPLLVQWYVDHCDLYVV